jgi:hypothetical protein
MHDFMFYARPSAQFGLLYRCQLPANNKGASEFYALKGEVMNKGLIAVTAVSLLMMGCKNEPYIVKSTLKVNQTLNIKAMTKPTSVNLNAGEYPTSLDINNARIKATVSSANSKAVTFQLLLPKKTVIPTNGTLSLTSKQSGQPFDTTIVVQTAIQNGADTRQIESCTVDYTDYECGVGGYPPHTICQPVMRTRWGSHLVEYHTRTYNRQVHASLLVAGANEPAATIEGARVDSEKVYTRNDICN